MPYSHYTRGRHRPQRSVTAGTPGLRLVEAKALVRRVTRTRPSSSTSLRYSFAPSQQIEPYKYLRALFERLPTHPADRLHELLPASLSLIVAPH